jgi:8-oxo-dGTP pyrophosphatase MutT (NUDIX family)
MAEVPSDFHDVVCGLLVSSGQVLLVHRTASRLWAPGRWDAPGGHVEGEETDGDALSRELAEELGVTFDAGDARLVGRLTGADYDARVFLLDSWSGEPENRAPHEHDELAWFGEAQLSSLLLADDDLLPIMLHQLRRLNP